MNIGKKLNRLKNEDFIWLIYFFIVIAALYSNNDERKYLFTKNNKYYKETKIINTIILTIAFFIYLYFVLLEAEDLNDYQNKLNEQSYIEHTARLVASILFLVGGAIYVILELVSKEPDEVGFI